MQGVKRRVYIKIGRREEREVVCQRGEPAMIANALQPGQKETEDVGVFPRQAKRIDRRRAQNGNSENRPWAEHFDLPSYHRHKSGFVCALFLKLETRGPELPIPL